MIKKFRVWLFNILTPILKRTATMHLPFTHKKVTGRDYYQLWPMLKPGTLFATKIRGDLTDILVPGYYTHIGIYCPRPGATIDESVVQAERDGVQRCDLVSFLTTKDDVLVFEPNLPSDKKDLVMLRAAEIAAAEVGKPYDYQFEYSPTDLKAFYCSELAWYAYDVACADYGLPSLFKPTKELDVDTITPQAMATSSSMTAIYHAGGK